MNPISVHSQTQLTVANTNGIHVVAQSMELLWKSHQRRFKLCDFFMCINNSFFVEMPENDLKMFSKSNDNEKYPMDLLWSMRNMKLGSLHNEEKTSIRRWK